MMLRVDYIQLYSVLTLCTLGVLFSGGLFEIFFSYFFPEIRIWLSMQIVSICLKCLILFSWKNKKNIINLLSAEFATRHVERESVHCNMRDDKTLCNALCQRGRPFQHSNPWLRDVMLCEKMQLMTCTPSAVWSVVTVYLKKPRTQRRPWLLFLLWTKVAKGSAIKQLGRWSGCVHAYLAFIAPYTQKRAVFFFLVGGVGEGWGATKIWSIL